MAEKPLEPWYNFFKSSYHGNDPCFFNREKLAWVDTVESSFDIIQKEMMAIINSREVNLKPYRFHEPTTGRVEWSTIPFVSWGYRFHKNCKLCPETIKQLESISGFVSASLSLLEPDSVIPLHQGDTNAIIRSHLGIVVPGILPNCGFKCGDQQQNWGEGKVLPFCDAQPHSAINNTSQRRYVIIIDVMRTEFVYLQSRVCATIITTHLLYAIDSVFKFYNKTSGSILKLFSFPIRLMIQLLLPIQRKMKFL